MERLEKRGERRCSLLRGRAGVGVPQLPLEPRSHEDIEESSPCK